MVFKEWFNPLTQTQWEDWKTRCHWHPWDNSSWGSRNSQRAFKPKRGLNIVGWAQFRWLVNLLGSLTLSPPFLSGIYSFFWHWFSPCGGSRDTPENNNRQRESFGWPSRCPQACPSKCANWGWLDCEYLGRGPYRSRPGIIFIPHVLLGLLTDKPCVVLFCSHSFVFHLALCIYNGFRYVYRFM